MIKPTLVLQPIHNSSADILRCFADGKPLSSDQLNFLAWHEHELSSSALDPLIKYYIESEKRKRHASFLLPHEKINAEDIKKLKDRIRATLKDKYSHAALECTEEQWMDFKKYTELELIFWSGNEFVSGTRFYVGGVIPAIYFQWAEFFGVWKYALIHANKTTMAKNIIYFEQMRDRDLNQCVADYKRQHQHELLLQQKLTAPKPIIKPGEQKIVSPRLTQYYHIDPLYKK